MPIYKHVDKTFFKKWSSNMAYVLGFFAADGYLTHNKRGAHFWSIQITDEKLLRQIKKVIKSEHKITIKKRRENEKTQYRLQIGSKEMFEDLEKLGFGELKTKNILIPPMPKCYLPDFIRGYFDGDGNVWVGYINRNRKRPTLVLYVMFTSCSRGFLDQLKERLRTFGVVGGSLYQANGEYYRLLFSTTDSLKIYEIMYNQSVLLETGLFLPRKKRVFGKYGKLNILRP